MIAIFLIPYPNSCVTYERSAPIQPSSFSPSLFVIGGPQCAVTYLLPNWTIRSALRLLCGRSLSLSLFLVARCWRRGDFRRWSINSAMCVRLAIRSATGLGCNSENRSGIRRKEPHRQALTLKRINRSRSARRRRTYFAAQRDSRERKSSGFFL